MMKFEGSHILSVSQFDRDAISRILEVSSLMAPYAMRKKRCHVLDGAILNNLFFEPSTRTRVSFVRASSLRRRWGLLRFRGRKPVRRALPPQF